MHVLGTIIGKVMKKFPSFFGFSVSHATRNPRAGEENGVHYHFVQKTDMVEAVAKGEFVESATVHENMYGTSFRAVNDVQSVGKICILDIDIQGVANVKKSSFECKYIFILPPSLEELESRLRKRGSETEHSIGVRMETAVKEITYGQEPGNFDALFTNDNLDDTVQNVIGQLQAWYPSFDFSKPVESD